MEENQIPKIIHYVWFGNKKKPDIVVKCIESWKKLQGFEIIEWNEHNFDINVHPFAKKAYTQHHWAFLSDYIRAWVIYNHGGIYFDTDVFLIDEKKFRKCLSHSAFTGFESDEILLTAVFGAKKHHPFVFEMLNYFDNNEVKFDKPNTWWVSDIVFDKFGCVPNNTEQLLNDDFAIYKKDFLCVPSKNSATVHLLVGSWLGNIKFSDRIGRFLRRHSNIYLVRLFYDFLVFLRSKTKPNKSRRR